jgi:hypothetical protein
MSQETTECVYCCKEIPWDEELFAEGNHGEPVCDECKEGE